MIREVTFGFLISIDELLFSFQMVLILTYSVRFAHRRFVELRMECSSCAFGSYFRVRS